MGKKEPLEAFVAWWRQYCRGDEKGEAQIFLDRLFKAFGHEGALEAGGQYESRVRRKYLEGPPTVAFADYLLPGKVLIEMKKRGEDLRKHYDQLERYWKSLEGRKPQYALLCNFDDIWIYEFPTQFYDPVDFVRVEDLPERTAALEFLVPGSRLVPVFGNNLVEVTREAAHAAVPGVPPYQRPAQTSARLPNGSFYSVCWPCLPKILVCCPIRPSHARLTSRSAATKVTT